MTRQRVRVALVGAGRMGGIHALNIGSLAHKTDLFECVAVVEPDSSLREAAVLAAAGREAPRSFSDVQSLIDSGIADAAIVATPTSTHESVSLSLLGAGFRVLLEKPLTATLETDRRFASTIDEHFEGRVMIGLQRRFDPPLLYARSLVSEGRIGRVFKIASSLEDSGPLPAGYASGGILADMAIHNVDEVLWWSERFPSAVSAVGNNLLSHMDSPVDEDFDDATLQLFFEERLSAVIQVSRNHRAGYRVETSLWGSEGEIHVGRFQPDPTRVDVECFSISGGSVSRSFTLAPSPEDSPEFLGRFGIAYRNELESFLFCCRDGIDFSVDQGDALRAMQILDAAQSGIRGGSDSESLTSS